MPSNQINLEKALGSPGRIRILVEMARNPRSISAYKLRRLTGLRGEDVKKHLQILVESGIVKELKVDHQRMYILDQENPVVDALINLFKLSGYI